ncbi:hypothetical protein Tco_0977554 [Tanacetum coccineum]|uniref:Uncharacterized protein n=1 Tax=Tanacetum coccineum TaxID=301880 RepID=A0ABQ5EKV9_9ASTR
MLSLRERMELDLEARLMGETLVLNRPLDPFFDDYIELNDLNEPFKLRINQGDDLMPTIEEGKVIEEFRTRDDELDAGIDDYPTYWALKQCNMDLTAAAKNRFIELNKLMELRDGAYENTLIYKERTKKWHDSRLQGDKDFKVGDLVLLFNSRFKMHPVDRNVLIVVGRSFLYTCGEIINTIKKTTTTFDEVCHQKFCVAEVKNNLGESDSDDEEDYFLKRDKMGKPFYGPNRARYLNRDDPMDHALALQEALNPFKKICVCKKAIAFLGSLLVPLQYQEWRPSRLGNITKEGGDGKWHTKIRIMDPYGNNYEQGMDDPNITMEEYIRLEEEKARRRDYTVIFDKNSFSYKIISVNDLKTDSENDNEKVNIPSLLPPEPTVSYFDDLDFFKDFEDEFPAIVYIDALTSKLDFLTEPTISNQHIDEFNLKDETSLSKCDEEEQNVLNFNDLFPFNVIYPNDSKSDKDNDDDKVDIEHSSMDLSVKPLPDIINTDVGAYAQGTVDMAYSLNENSVYDTCINMAYPGDLTEKKMTTLLKYLRFGNFKVLES